MSLFDGVSCTDCGLCSTSKIPNTATCACDGWTPDSGGICLPECNEFHLGPAGRH
jgi:hypothetical protein